jgi:hypothetical protein
VSPHAVSSYENGNIAPAAAVAEKDLTSIKSTDSVLLSAYTIIRCNWHTLLSFGQ